MTSLVARTVFPLSLVVGAALWIGGYAEVGDGFSAGVTAGLGALLQYVCFDRERAGRMVGGRWAFRMIAAGLLLTLVVVLAPIAAGAPPVFHWPRPTEHVPTFGGIEAHTALLFDLGVGLAVYGSLVATAGRLFPPTREQPE